MPATDYASLIAQATLWAGGSSDTNFPTTVADAISFAEVDLDTTLWVPERVKRVFANFTAEFEAIPDDCKRLLSIRRVVDGVEDASLRQTHPDTLPGLARNYGGLPTWYALLGAQVQLAPKPTVDDPMRVRWIYYGAVPRLSSDAPCTAVLTSYPQVYLYTTLKHLAPFSDDAEGAQKWAAMSDNAIATANRAGALR